ncbi:pleckstrin homology domain-containing family H member 3-like isoform X1 [Sinocyclocheilus grahami]|uniref:pleckstrin homology domain-containing family H member 3-like isoform X1 n=1 Tax=Sinocyclocheilus grahami TaxID=75366 RepID=UPI0007AC7D7F|nr:PREDICTED: pleckstrin homology domain-containing family H member 3-like isoform X1 [Sinocyclocheilus grahami]
MPLRGLCWLACCRQGFSLLARDHGEKEEEESFELRNQDEHTHTGRGQLEVTLSQPTRTANGTPCLSGVPEEKRSLITQKSKMKMDKDNEVLMKGWLLREVQGGWLRQRRFWFVLTTDSLDYYSGLDRDARRLGMLVLTSLCSVLWPDKHTYKQTGYWSLTVYGRKHCYRLFTKHYNEAVHWACAVQKVIDSKAPVETPTQLLIRDIEENKFNPEVVEHIYEHNPILRYTQSPLYAPLLPFPYGSLHHTHMASKGYTSIREEAVRLFNCLQQLELAREPIPLIQGILQTCLDLRLLRDELYCQLIKQTSVTNLRVQTQTRTQPNPQLRYWQLLTCMSCTFLPSCSILRYLRFHLKRVQSLNVDPEVESYASFIAQALEKTRGRECVPSWEEIQGLMGRQEILCTVHYPGPGCCQIPITSHTTANEVVRKMAERLGLQESRNTFALFEQNACWEKAIGGSTIIADVIARFENLSAKDPDSDCQCRLCFKLYCLLDTDNISTDSIEYLFLYEQCHEMVVRGQLPACEDDLLSLAALRLQCLLGDFSALSPYPPLEQLFPAEVVEARALLAPVDPPGCPSFPGGLLAGTLWGHKRRQEQDQRLRARLREEGAVVMSAILECWKALAGYSRRDSMAAYLTIARQWSGFGCTLYEVDFYISSTGSFSQKLWLGVAASCVSLYRQGEAEALESLPIGQICSYGVSDSNTFRITAGDRDLLFETSKLTEIMQLMNAYFSATRRQLGKDDCISMETNPKLHPSLLELPSHPV